MKLINSSYKIVEQQPGINGIYQAIESAGRTCYKSSDKITEDSAKPFVDRMIKSGHGAMLEHGTVYLESSDGFAGGFYLLRRKYERNPYSRVKIVHSFVTGIDHIYVTTNLRVLVENGWLDDLQYICEPTEFHEKRICVRFTCSIGISRELNRHRVNSMAEQSTRYCNFSKDKFGGEISFIEPSWYKDNIDGQACFIKSCEDDESHYLWMINELHMKPQQARDILPLATATEVNHCAFLS